VLTPDIDDPTLNPLYRDVLAHYGVVALPCRIGEPDRQGKVESGIGHTQNMSIQGMLFETLEEAQACLDRWDARAKSIRSFVRTAGTQSSRPTCAWRRGSK
jgi:transposase